MDIQDLRIFARVAAVQNLSAVGTELGLTPGTISKRIQALEDELGVRLFDRTTRSIRITEEGSTFFRHAERILAELDSARASLGDCVLRPKGKLKISAPASLARQFIAPAICQFMSDYQEIDVQLDLSDRLVNLQEEGYDVAIRTGVLSDSALIAKRLAPDPHIIVASPCYLSRNGIPATPEDIVRHDCLVLGDAFAWNFIKNGEQQTVRVSGRLRSNNGEFLRLAALAGRGGLYRTSEMRVREDLDRKTLIRVLPDYELSTNSAVWAVYPSSKHVLPKLRVLLNCLAEWFRDGSREAKPPIKEHLNRPVERPVAETVPATAGAAGGPAKPALVSLGRDRRRDRAARKVTG